VISHDSELVIEFFDKPITGSGWNSDKELETSVSSSLFLLFYKVYTNTKQIRPVCGC